MRGAAQGLPGERQQGKCVPEPCTGLAASVSGRAAFVPTSPRRTGVWAAPSAPSIWGCPAPQQPPQGKHSRSPPEPKLGTRGILLFPPKRNRCDSAASGRAADSPWTESTRTRSSAGASAGPAQDGMSEYRSAVPGGRAGRGQTRADPAAQGTVLPAGPLLFTQKRPDHEVSSSPETTDGPASGR